MNTAAIAGCREESMRYVVEYMLTLEPFIFEGLFSGSSTNLFELGDRQVEHGTF